MLPLLRPQHWPCVRTADSDRAAWEQFVATCPEATFFHRIEWRELLERSVPPPHALSAGRAWRRLVGVLPLARSEEPAVRPRARLAAVRRAAGVAATDADGVTALHATARATGAVARRAPPRAAQRRAARTGLAAAGPVCRRSARRSLPTPTRTCARFRASSGRWCARRSQRGLAAEIDGDARRFFALYADNVHRHGTPALPRRYFDELLRRFGRDCEVLTVVDADGRAGVRRAELLLPRRRCCRTTPATSSPRATSPRTTSSTGN